MKDQRAAAESIQDRQAAERFAEQLRALRSAAGDPSFRKMAGRSGRISHTTLHEAAAGTRFPSWETTREFVRACEADEAQWRRRWEDAQRPGESQTIPEGGLAPVVADFPTGAGSPATADGTQTGVETSGGLGTPAAHGPAVSGVDASASKDQGALTTVEYPQAEDDVESRWRGRLPWLNAAAVVLVVAMAAVLAVTVRGRSSPADSDTPSASPSVASPSASAFSDSLIPGDASKFVADVTIPDGTQVKVNAQFDKVWALANVGKVDWHNRFLARIDPAADGAGCRTPDRVSIGDTPPGEQVMIRVRVTAPNRPGKCWVSWKMVDETGREYFPTRRPVYFMVTVTA
ncbi:NBR1-Ig-like domain-containing protein [Micromonospora lupini]|uniref:NBR1-Ig-like domain-containing protein n=1 Tax=Micromonospora lupini TaxID=285679 RepID=UPI002259A29B|nr:NBR1-Ig-like domain-containing protein [Micromonospora lupini]MCX5065736.1 NBR1-Ig-like domain-containing protein [Micromonospora lupini]